MAAAHHSFRKGWQLVSGLCYMPRSRSNRQMEARTIKDGNFHWANNAILDGYGRLLGPDALAVYYALCRFANNRTQRCWPSQSTIANRTGMTRRTVRKALRKLEGFCLVEIERHLGGASNYCLLSIPPGHGIPTKTRRNNKTRSLDSTAPQSLTKISRVDFVLIG